MSHTRPLHRADRRRRRLRSTRAARRGSIATRLMSGTGGAPETRGFDHPLYVLPFDHRGSFESGLFGWKGALDAGQTARITEAKQVIYDGFRAAVAGGVPIGHAGILVDEQFGSDILRDAAARGYLTAAPAEKSGQKEFDFEYGEEFARHIEAFHATFCKVLVRYNPEAD